MDLTIRGGHPRPAPAEPGPRGHDPTHGIRRHPLITGLLADVDQDHPERQLQTAPASDPHEQFATPLLEALSRSRRYQVNDKVSATRHEHALDVGSRMNPVLALTWLLVNGAPYGRFRVLPDSRADIVVLDIEDAVAPKDKVAAAKRDQVARQGTALGRVNGFGTQWWADDLEMLAGTSMGGVMLAMVESVNHVTETAKRLPNVPIVALVETARGLERITEIAAAKGTFRLAFGIGDFRRDTGYGDNPTTLAYARSRFTIAAKAAHLPSAIDGPTVGSSALKLSEATAVSAEFGMTGKICLTPDQCPTVNEGLSPSLDEITWAKEFFVEFERDGGEIRNGSDLPRIARANKILDLARAYGIEPSEFDDVDDPAHIPAPSDTYHY